VEATAIICREFPNLLEDHLVPLELQAGQDFLYQPGISVLREAQLAAETGQVTGMHDPTEGGLYGALWELAQASDKALAIDLSRVPVPEISRRVCVAVGIDPLGAIASGSLLLAVKSNGAAEVCSLLGAHGITCTEIGEILAQPAGVWSHSQVGELALPRPERDEIARLFDE
jgi:hydrogenase maturation factor